MVALILLILNFVLIQASYGSLVRPNLSSNSTLTCDSLMRITGQGAVYVRTLLSEDSDSGDETGVPEISFSCSAETSRRQNLAVAEPLQTDIQGWCVMTFIIWL